MVARGNQWLMHLQCLRLSTTHNGGLKLQTFYHTLNLWLLGATIRAPLHTPSTYPLCIPPLHTPPRTPYAYPSVYPLHVPPLHTPRKSVPPPHTPSMYPLHIPPLHTPSVYPLCIPLCVPPPCTPLCTDWLMSPPQPIRSLGFKNLINIKS